MRKILILLLATFLTGCSYFHLYKPDVQQGNIMEAKQVNQLRTGMTKFQVEQIMGQTILEDTFTKNQIAYVYTFTPAYGKTIKKRVVLTFKDNQLAKIEKDLPADDSSNQ